MLAGAWKQVDMQLLQVEALDQQAPVFHASHHVFDGIPVKLAEDASSALRYVVHATHLKRRLKVFFGRWQFLWSEKMVSCAPRVTQPSRG